MAEEALPETKLTKYEIIYKETSKKLNQYCVNEIYKKYQKKEVRENREGKRQSLNTMKILSHFENKVEDHLRKASKGAQVKNQEEGELDEIVRSLRYEGYQESFKIERKARNPVSILCCLVGHRKAKRIVEQELNH